MSKNPRFPAGAAGVPTRLRTLRKALGLHQEHVAVQLGLSRNAYGEYERGGSKMTLKLALSIANILKCSPGWLAFGEGAAPDQLSPGPAAT
jgi:transcriptional regulator with XRE-family HTH domain